MTRSIDHVVFAADNLETVRQSFEAAGFETFYGGTHSNGVTHMHLIGFGNLSYVELISKNDLEKTAPWWDEQIDTNAGATAWSITVEDIEAESERLADEGFEIEGPTKFSRERPDGTVVEWELAVVGERPQGTPLPMLEMDHTPLEWRVTVTAAPETTGLMGLTDVVIGTNPERFEETVEGFKQFLGDAEPTVYENEPFGARIASFEDSPAAIAEPLDTDSWLSERVNAHDTLLPCAFLVEATDIETVKQQFELDGETSWENGTVHWFDVDVGGRFGAIDRS